MAEFFEQVTEFFGKIGQFFAFFKTVFQALTNVFNQAKALFGELIGIITGLLEMNPAFYTIFGVVIAGIFVIIIISVWEAIG